MEVNLQVFLLVSLTMALVMTLLFMINVLFAKKISPKMRYFMWVVVMMGLLIPFRPTIGDGVIEIPNFTGTSVATELQARENNSTILAKTSITTSDSFIQDVVENESIPFQLIVVIIWVTVALAIIGYHLFHYMRFQITIKRWGETEEELATLELFNQIKQEMGLEKGKVRLVVCRFVSTSMLTGFFKPTILLPERNYDEAELALIFRHELIHYRRKDLWIKLLSVIAVAIHWFNPLVYLMNLALQTEGEASCDQEVLKRSKLSNRHFYAEVIIGMIGGEKSGMMTLATNFYGGKNGIKKRLEEVMTTHAPRKFASYLLLAVIVVLTVASGSVFGVATTVNMPQVSDVNFFEHAIAIVGGGELVDYQIDEAVGMIVVRVFQEGDMYIVQLDDETYQIRGLSTYLLRSEAVENSPNGPEIVAQPEAINETVQAIPPPSTDLNPQNPAIINQKAIDIASAFVNERGHTSATLLKSELDFEYDRWVWEVAFSYHGSDIEVYVDATDGTIIKFEVDID